MLITSGNYVHAMDSRTNTEDVYFVIGVLQLPIKKIVLNVCPSIFFLTVTVLIVCVHDLCHPRWHDGTVISTGTGRPLDLHLHFLPLDKREFWSQYSVCCRMLMMSFGTGRCWAKAGLVLSVFQIQTLSICHCVSLNFQNNQ